MEINKLKRQKTNSYTIKDFYIHYISGLGKEYDSYKIDYKTYRMIVEDYFEWIRNTIIENGRNFKMPYRLGRLNIIKKRIKFSKKTSLPIDFYNTKKFGKLIYQLNEHSNYYKYRFYWDKKEMLIKNKNCYRLIMTRSNKRRLAQIIKNRERDYIGI